MGVSVPIIIHPGGVMSDDIKSYGHAPVQADVGLGIARDPVAGGFVALCALPGMFTASGASKLGYLALMKKTAGVVGTTPDKKIRLLTADHPDGG